VFHTGLLGIDWWRIAEIVGLCLTGSFLPSAWSLGLLGQGAIGGGSLMMWSGLRRRLRHYRNRRLRNRRRRRQSHVIRHGFLDVRNDGRRLRNGFWLGLLLGFGS
jgi:hypothetical protein